MGARMFFLSKACLSAYLAVHFFYAYEIEVFRCIIVQECVWPHVVMHNDAWLWQLLWATAALVAVATTVASGNVRRFLAAFLLVCWSTGLARTEFTPPHIAFVSLAIVHLVASPARRDRVDGCSGSRDCAWLLLVMLRCALACGNGGSGFAKLAFSPVWTEGVVFHTLVAHCMRFYVRTSETLTALISRASPALSFGTLVIGLGSPFFELAAELLPRCHLLAPLSWAASASLPHAHAYPRSLSRHARLPSRPLRCWPRPVSAEATERADG